MGVFLGCFFKSSPTQTPKALHFFTLDAVLLVFLPAQQRQLRDCLGTLPWGTNKSQTTSLLLWFQWSPAIPPTILSSIKRLLCHPPATMTATDNQSVTHDGTRPTQAGFVAGTLQWSGHVQVWPHSVTSPTPAGAAPCALTQMLMELLKRAVKAQTKAPLASPQAQRPGPGLLWSCAAARSHTGLALHSSLQRDAALALRCLCVPHLSFCSSFVLLWSDCNHNPAQKCTQNDVTCTCTPSSQTGKSRAIQSNASFHPSPMWGWG